MRAREIMTSNPACCLPETPLPEVARLMCDNDCGAIPVIDGAGAPLGVVTDRDIACRIVAERKDALQSTALDCMTRDPVTVRPDTSIEDCCLLLERNQL